LNKRKLLIIFLLFSSLLYGMNSPTLSAQTLDQDTGYKNSKIDRYALDREFLNTRYLNYSRNRVSLIIMYDRHPTKGDLDKVENVTKSKRGFMNETLPFVNGVTITVSLPHFPDFEHYVEFLERVASLASVRKVWLNHVVTLRLNASVPLIRVPEVWQLTDEQGRFVNGTGTKIAVLDTGIDKIHPDLDDLDDDPSTNDPKVIFEECFTGENKVTDGFGHGTHVASIAAGTGEASGYLYVGVAPQAWLINGKVLTDQGIGYESWIIQAIDWAVTNGATIINLSLGADVNGDGTDLLSVACDNAVDQGVIVCIASGNIGDQGYNTVGIPGVARKAITVGASVKTPEDVAGFSSKGPTGDYRVKPDVVAPGQDIVAARAAGTGMGDPIDQYYTSASGTSMATPHVSGSAALLKQLHPKWTPEMVKSALTNTAVDLSRDIYVQGAGKIDAYSAASNGALLIPGSISLGQIQLGGTYTADVEIKNNSTSTETVNLAVSEADNIFTGSSGNWASLNTTGLEVPAGESRWFRLTLSLPASVETGYYQGNVIATLISGQLDLIFGFASPYVVIVSTSGLTSSSYRTRVYLDGVDQDQPYLWDGLQRSFSFELPPQAHTISVNQYVSGPTGTRYYCSQSSIVVSDSGTITFTYQTQYRLTVDTLPSGITSPTGTGWYGAGADAPISVSPVVGYEFKYWYLDGQSATPYSYDMSTTVTMDSPHTATAYFLSKYALLFPHVFEDSTWNSYIQIFNSAGLTASVTIQCYDNSGNLLNSHSTYLAPRASIAVKPRDLNNGAKFIGSVVAGSDQLLTGFYRYTNVAGTMVDSYNALTSTQNDLYFPHVFENSHWTSTIVLLNPSSSAATVTIQVYNDLGVLLNTYETIIAAHAKLVAQPRQFNNDHKFVGSLVVQPDVGLAGCQIYMNTGYTRTGAFSVGSSPSAILYYPHVFENSMWSSYLVLFNPSSSQASVTIKAYNNAGNLLNVFSTTIRPRAKLGALPAVFNKGIKFAGSLIVESTQGVVGYLACSNAAGTVSFGYLASPIGSKVINVTHVIDTTSWAGYVAIFNPSNSAAYVTVYAYDTSGNLLNAYTANIQPDAKLGATPRTLNKGKYFTGSLVINSDQPLVFYFGYTSSSGTMTGCYIIP